MLVTRIEEFYNANKQELFSYALSLTGNIASAEDAVHNAVAAVLRRESLPEDMKPYLFKCVRNAAMDCRRYERKRMDSIFELRKLKYGNESGFELFDVERLSEALSRLPDNEKETIVLKIYDELTFSEIADVMAAPMNTVASWYRRGLEKLRRIMEDASDG